MKSTVTGQDGSGVTEEEIECDIAALLHKIRKERFDEY